MRKNKIEVQKVNEKKLEKWEKMRKNKMNPKVKMRKKWEKIRWDSSFNTLQHPPLTDRICYNLISQKKQKKCFQFWFIDVA